MISNELQETIDTQFRIKKLLWIGLTVGLILYFLAVYFITIGKEPNPNLSRTTEYVFAAAGLILFFIVVIIRRIVYSDNRLKNILVAQQSNTQNLPEILNKYLSRQQIFYIIILAINDSIGILGIAIGFISRDINKALPYIVVAILLNFWVYPKKEQSINNLRSLGQL
ncbi:MAG: hypothetical protein GWO07_02125 [Candidatus Dadabacteria bacterium]|nr:hypothetical protein [Candidatus Dadabacteria bacterium]NIS07566.1 hypothetical protein [Candidatus Dadabacteria bacterium]NIY21181.1 hypothetical protein [Candidatus Dadabacteria bacterium]